MSFELPEGWRFLGPDEPLIINGLLQEYEYVRQPITVDQAQRDLDLLKQTHEQMDAEMADLKFWRIINRMEKDT
jgi:hypothetical protein